MATQEQIGLFRMIAAVLLRCFLFSVALMMLSFICFLVAGDFAYSIHSRLFTLTRSQFDLLYYYSMALIKISAFMFFLVPYIAMRLVIRDAEKGKGSERAE